MDRPGRYLGRREATVPETGLGIGWVERSQALQDGSDVWREHMAEVCEGSTQGRLVWAGGHQAFSEHPHEMVGGRLDHGSGTWLQDCGGHRE